MLYTRDGDGKLGIRSAVVLEGADAMIDIPDLTVTLAFSVLYEGLEPTSEQKAGA
jgi:hypothetical protein